VGTDLQQSLRMVLDRVTWRALRDEPGQATMEKSYEEARRIIVETRTDIEINK